MMIYALLFLAAAVEVRHDDQLCLTYQASVEGEYLVVRAEIQPGWHTFAMDNKQRAEEKLAGKRALSNDLPTSFTATSGLEVVGPWRQTAPKDFSRPELRWFSWGFERQAVFAAKARRTGAGPAQIGVRAQACTESICKNIDVTVPVDLGPSRIDVKNLIPVISSR